MGVVYVGIHVLIFLKEELDWATDKRLWNIRSYIMVFKTVVLLKY